MNWRTWDLNLRTRLIGDTLFNLLFWMYFPFMTLYFSQTFGKNAAGLLMSVPPLIGIAGSLLGGRMSDRLGRRPAMLLGAALQAVMFALFAASLCDWCDYAAFIGISLGGSIYAPAGTAMVADLTPEKERRRVFAAFVTAMNIGAVFGPALGSAFFFAHRGELLWACTFVTAAYAVAIFFIVRETLPQAARQRERGTGEPRAEAALRGYIAILRDRAFALYIAAGIFVTIAFMQLDLYLAVYVKEYVPAQTLLAGKGWTFQLDGIEVFGWMMGLNGLLYVLGVMPITKRIGRWSDRNVLMLSALLFGIGMFLIGLTSNAWLLFGFMAVATIGEIMRSPVLQSFVSKYAPEEARGRYMGASNLQVSIGRFLAPATVVLSAWMSPVGVFGIILLCALIGILLYAILFRRLAADARG
ncbi:MFS transporter [Cohnella zeiphila]|uniref:MFS transporter n=1 Tax=Cohnella zeiphila TaxID=2761120 RepID=A0A7X0SRN9_9BACL|nr:MFS transporter [Cohnella zeiphila]